jgi:hypothetical protein
MVSMAASAARRVAAADLLIETLAVAGTGSVSLWFLWGVSFHRHTA